MYCYVHTDVESIGTCSNCGKSVCQECAVDTQGKLVCRDCLSKGQITLAKGQISTEKEFDPNTAFIIELIAGFFGFLGVGYLWVGRTNDGVIRLIGWLIFVVIAGIVIAILVSLTVGFAACICLPIQLAIQIGVPFWSANNLKNELISESTTIL